MLSDEEVDRIASAVVEKASQDVGIRDVIIGSAVGEGAIPLYGRELRKEPCSCCLIEPEGPNAPENRMCTTSEAIGTLKDSEEREWCSEINIVADGRCERARSIREAARVCKEKYPDDTAKFFECYAPAFSKITKGSNPGMYPRSAIPEPYQKAVRRELRKIPTWKLQEAYSKLKVGEATGIELVEQDRAYATSAIKEVIFERGKLGGKPSYLKQDSGIYDIPFAQRIQAEMMKEMRQPFRELLSPGKFPKRDEALSKLGKFTIAEVHDDGDLTVRSADKLYVVTTDGKTFEQKSGGYVTITDPGKTTFKVGEAISRDAFEKENERVTKLGEKPATGR